MATATLRPNATSYNSGWTVVGASAHGATDDDPVDDATYVQAASGAWLLVFDLGPLTLPAYAQIRSVSVRVRRRGNSSAVLDVACGYQPRTGGYQSSLLSAGEKPTSTIATKTYSSLVSAPGGAAWDNNTIIPNLQVSLGANSSSIRVYEVYCDVVYDEAPTVVVTAPVGTVRGSQVPAVTFSYADPEGASLERVRAKLFTAAQVAAAGFLPDVTAAFWDSGTVLASAQSLAVTTPLPGGDYHVYVRAADAGSGGRFGPWASAQFTMGGELPAVPSLGVSADSAHRRNVVTVTQNDNYMSYGQSSTQVDGNEGDGWYAETDNTSLASISSTAPTAGTLAETFTGADGALSAANTDIDWTVVAGAFAVASNQLTSSNAALLLPPVIRTNSDVASSNHFAQVQVVTLDTANDRSVHLVLRMSSSSYAGYVVELNQQFNRFAVWRAVNSTTGRAISGFRPLPKVLALPATWRAEVSGSTVSVYIQMANDSSLQLLGQWTDTAITSGTRIGLGLYNANSISKVGNFSAGDLTPVVSGSSGTQLLEMTATNARQGRAFTGGRYGWGTPVTGGEQLTLTASAWQKSNAARSCRVDVEYHAATGDPLVNAVFADEWTGADGSAWSGNWTTSHAGAATSSIQSNQGRMVTGTTAYGSPARAYASGMSAIADCEVTCLVVCSSTTAEMRGLVAVRTDGTYDGAAPSYPGAGYMVEVDPQNDVILIRKAGVGVPVLATPGKNVPGEGLYVRLRVHGSTVAAKAWAASVQEPAVWDWIGEDTTWPAAGKVTVTAQNGADAVARTVTFDHLVVDDMSYHSFGSTFTTNTDGTLAAHTRNLVVPAAAAVAKTVLVAFPAGAGEKFVWNKLGLLPGAGRPWSRGGLMVPNRYGPNDSSFEVAAAGVAGWTAGAGASLSRVNFVLPATNPEAAPTASGGVLRLSWSGSSGLPDVIYAYGPGKPAAAGLDYAVRAWVYRIDANVSILRLGIRFTNASGDELAVSVGANVLPDAGTTWADATHTVRAPGGTAYAHAVLAASPVTTGSAAVTRVCLVQGTAAPTVFQPGPAAAGYARVEYSDDGGQTWERVRGTAAAAYGPDRVVTVYDNEAPPGAARLYRASTAAVDYYLDSAGGATVASQPSATVSATLPAGGFWIRDPLVPARLLEIKHSGDLDHTSSEPQEVHRALGRRNPVVVSDVVTGEVFSWPLTFTSDAGYRRFEEMRAAGSPLLFQSDFGEEWFVKLGDQRKTVLKRSQNRAAVPVRAVELTAVEVDRPDPDESNAGIVTGTVWETV